MGASVVFFGPGGPRSFLGQKGADLGRRRYRAHIVGERRPKCENNGGKEAKLFVNYSLEI
jgi:hypothetical protein